MMTKFFPGIETAGLLLIVHLLPLTAAVEVDTFGIRQIYPTKPETGSWNSAHWNNGNERTVRYGSDEYDPTDWTEDHSSGTDGFRIDGRGTMTMSGSGPRFHINSMDSSKVPAQFFRDVEFTAYYQRYGNDGADWGGMVVGVRSGPLGHASPGGNNCDATTYYARFRNDGKWDFEKELKHPGSTYWSGSGFNKQDPLWNGNPLPLGRWIGMKFIVYTIENNSEVGLELYIDSLSDGSPDDGGVWELVGRVTDKGSWPSGDVTGCAYEQNAVISEGHGTVLMRTDGDTAVYTMVSVREIDPVSPAITSSGTSGYNRRRNDTMLQPLMTGRGMYIIACYPGGTGYRMYSLRGRLISSGRLISGGRYDGMPDADLIKRFRMQSFR